MFSVDGDLGFGTDLYRGTAAFYDQFRLSYPDALIRDLVERAVGDRNGSLLDLACGTGQVAFALCNQFAEVCAVDQEPDMIEFGRRQATRLGVQNIRWIVQRAEDVDADASFALVTIGNGFRRVGRRRVADRVPAGLNEEVARRTHVAVLADAGLSVIGRYEFTEVHEWTLRDLLGFVYSTSLLPRLVVGDQRAAFEGDMKDRLLAAEPSGIFSEEYSAAYDLACPIT